MIWNLRERYFGPIVTMNATWLLLLTLPPLACTRLLELDHGSVVSTRAVIIMSCAKNHGLREPSIAGDWRAGVLRN